IIPDNVDFDIIDQFIKVTDKDSALRAREMARKEALLVGYSSGSTLQCVHDIKDQLTEDDVVVILCSDHGSRYLGKVYNDEWMRQQGFLHAPKQENDESKTYEGLKKKLSSYRMKYKKYIRETIGALKSL
ncbi:MAG: cystathionine beta-synthase, partial [Bacteroidota bacterium]